MGASPGAKILIGSEKESGLLQAAASPCKDTSARHSCAGGKMLIFTPVLFTASSPSARGRDEDPSLGLFLLMSEEEKSPE